jgi:hypothetical protein
MTQTKFTSSITPSFIHRPAAVRYDLAASQDVAQARGKYEH